MHVEMLEIIKAAALRVPVPLSIPTSLSLSIYLSIYHSCSPLCPSQLSHADT
jgi:hypothetical protein